MSAPALLFHLSDIHFGLEDNRALDWVRDEIARARPDAVAITGDLTMRARAREFDAAREWILSLEAPVTVEVGNHDMPYFNPVERFLAPYARFRGMESLIAREIDLPGLAIVPLKTAARAQWRLNWSKGWVTRAALDKCLADQIISKFHSLLLVIWLPIFA
ncbi:metallophosphoesterase [Leptolyngbya sp. 15MV]|nr:metallophosphoesterase [Leptolyngbya sp. 15MV]